MSISANADRSKMSEQMHRRADLGGLAQRIRVPTPDRLTFSFTYQIQAIRVLELDPCENRLSESDISHACFVLVPGFHEFESMLKYTGPSNFGIHIK